MVTGWPGRHAVRHYKEFSLNQHSEVILVSPLLFWCIPSEVAVYDISPPLLSELTNQNQRRLLPKQTRVHRRREERESRRYADGSKVSLYDDPD